MKRIIRELQRRRVVRSAAAYIVIAWLIVQVISTLGADAGLPAWTMRFVLISLAVGFPIAMIGAWFFAFTKDGLRREHEVDDSAPLQDGRSIDFIVIAILVAALGVSLYFNRGIDTLTDSARASVQPVLAVLPFADLSGIDTADGFVEGLHDNLLTTLAQINSLHIISRTSVLPFREDRPSLRDIGARLGASAILEGSVQRNPQKISVNVKLIDTRSDKNLWSGVYERPFNTASIFAIQKEIARAISTELSAELSADDTQQLERVPTTNMEAYRAFLLGKRRAEERTSDSLDEAVSWLQKAINLDPTYADAYASLAMAYVLQNNYGNLTQEQMNNKAMPLVQRALRIDDRLAEAHTVLADLRSQQGDVGGAETAFERAIALNPSSVLARHWYGIMLLNEGRYAEALVQHKHAQQLDPMSVIVTLNVAQDQMYLGDTGAALLEYRRGLEIDPEFVPAYAHMAMVYREGLGRPDESIRWLQKAYARDSGHTEYPSQLAESYLDLDDVENARLWATRAYAIGPTQYWPNRAQLLLALFENDVAAITGYAGYMHANVPGSLYALSALAQLRLDSGDPAGARTLYFDALPELFESPPRVTSSNFAHAVRLAHVLLATGEAPLATELLALALQKMTGLPRTGPAGIEVFDIEAYLLQGDRARALSALAEVADSGWTHTWWMMRTNPVFAAVRDEPVYQQFIDGVAGKMKTLREQLASEP